jgi:hypothetical protein
MRWRTGLGVLAGAALVAAAVLYVGADRPAPIDFVDALTGPETTLDIPFDRFHLSPEGLVRSMSLSASGDDRPLVRTLSSGYLTRDFVFEVEIAIPADASDLAFVGFGSVASAPPYNEPCDAWVFRVHHLPETHKVQFGGCQLVPSKGGASHVVLETLGEFPASGTLTVQLERAGEQLTARLPGDPGTARTFRMSEFPAVLTHGVGYLFFGNSSVGTSFRNVKVRTRT